MEWGRPPRRCALAQPTLGRASLRLGVELRARARVGVRVMVRVAIGVLDRVRVRVI